MHVLVACAPLPASTGMVHGPGGAGHAIAVVAGVGWVVGAVGVAVVMAVAADKKETLRWILSNSQVSSLPPPCCTNQVNILRSFSF